MLTDAFTELNDREKQRKLFLGGRASAFINQGVRIESHGIPHFCRMFQPINAPAGTP